MCACVRFYVTVLLVRLLVRPLILVLVLLLLLVRLLFLLLLLFGATEKSGFRVRLRPFSLHRRYQ